MFLMTNRIADAETINRLAYTGKCLGCGRKVADSSIDKGRGVMLPLTAEGTVTTYVKGDAVTSVVVGPECRKALNV